MLKLKNAKKILIKGTHKKINSTETRTLKRANRKPSLRFAFAFASSGLGLWFGFRSAGVGAAAVKPSTDESLPETAAAASVHRRIVAIRAGGERKKVGLHDRRIGQLDLLVVPNVLAGRARPVRCVCIGHIVVRQSIQQA